jgi:hypothetical protein
VRHGVADAVVAIVASRRIPMLNAEDLCEVVGCSPAEVREALVRLKDQHRPKLRAVVVVATDGPKYGQVAGRGVPEHYELDAEGRPVCPVDGCGRACKDARGLAAHMRSHIKVPCPEPGCDAVIADIGIGSHMLYAHGKRGD